MSSEPPEFEQDELESQPIVIIDLTPEFYRNLRDLNKRYRRSNFWDWGRLCYVESKSKKSGYSKGQKCGLSLDLSG
jgi:hypothetical protein